MPVGCLPPAAIDDVLHFQRALDERRDARPLAGGDERAEVVLVVVRLIELERFRGGGEFSDELVVDLLAGVDAAGGGAVLARVVIAENLHALDDGGEIGVVEHDDRRLAAKFEMRALDGLGGGGEHLLARRDVAGQRDHRDLRMIDDRGADGFAAPDDDVDDAGGKDLGDQPRELERGQRRLLRGLQHDRIAARERWRKLPRRHHQRIVPWRDRPDDSDGIAADHRRMARRGIRPPPRHAWCAPRRRRSGSNRQSPAFRR